MISSTPLLLMLVASAMAALPTVSTATDCGGAIGPAVVSHSAIGLGVGTVAPGLSGTALSPRVGNGTQRGLNGMPYPGVATVSPVAPLLIPSGSGVSASLSRAHWANDVDVAPPLAVAGAENGSVALAGREVDARVAAIAYRLAVVGVTRCPTPVTETGLILQHLSQFQPADRAGMVAALALDRGPAVIAVVPGSPGAAAGVRTGDVLIAVDGVLLPPEPGLADPFDAARAHARADAVQAILARPGRRALAVWRAGTLVTLRLDPVPACPSLVRLARSGQRNAYADGTHVFMTTGLVARLTNDDELAFVIAHELAHNILGHAAMMRGPGVARGLGRTMGRSGAIVRAAEREADALGGTLMLDAGYDPVRGAEVLRRVGGTDLGIAIFAAHAPVGQRIAAMRALAAARSGR